MRKKISILGSTGSIGKNVLKIASQLKEQIQVIALAANENIDLLEKQALEHSPEVICVYNSEKAQQLQLRLPHIEVLSEMKGLCQIATYDSVELVVAAMVGAIGLIPTAEAIKAKKNIALANKEVLIAGGSYILPLVKQYGVSLIPIDSEHNAIFQCLKNENPRDINRIILTSSGGPFREWKKEHFPQITPKDALKHPNFNMGAKITIDSSTLMNKGLEVIEAYWLFDVPLDKIEVLIHPQQKVHGLIEFKDGSILAQMSEPDMTIPIQYALTYPKRLKSSLPPYDFTKNKQLNFDQPNPSLFRCLFLAYESLRIGGTMPCFMNAANEILVYRFLNKDITWLEISEKLERLMSEYTSQKATSLEAILEADTLGRYMAHKA